MVLARARPRGPIANVYLVLNLFLAGDRMVDAQSYLSKPRSYENATTNIFIEKSKPGKAATRAPRPWPTCLSVSSDDLVLKRISPMSAPNVLAKRYLSLCRVL